MIAFDLPAEDIVVPAMHLEALFGEGLLDVGVGTQVIQLDEDVGVGKSLVAGQLAGISFDFVDVLPSRLDVLKPFADAIEALEGFGRHKGADDAAIGVAAHDEVAHAEDLDSVFNGR